jgi:hypothetical protein
MSGPPVRFTEEESISKPQYLRCPTWAREKDGSSPVDLPNIPSNDQGYPHDDAPTIKNAQSEATTSDS